MVENIITIVATVVGTLGGWEAIKWFLTRKSNTRIAEASAEEKELHNEIDEFRFLRERLEFKDQQLIDKEKRFSEQTEVLRTLNKQLLEQTIENGKLQANIARLETERSLKLCEVKMCPNRQPQSGY